MILLTNTVPQDSLIEFMADSKWIKVTLPLGWVLSCINYKIVPFDLAKFCTKEETHFTVWFDAYLSTPDGSISLFKYFARLGDPAHSVWPPEMNGSLASCTFIASNSAVLEEFHQEMF